MEKKRVVVTGMGIVSPIGNSVDTFWDNVKNQKVGIKEIDRFDASEYKAKLAAQVEDFNPADYMDPKAARRMELFSQYAVAATKQALDDSGLDLETEDVNRIGVCVGSGIGSLPAMENGHAKLLEKEAINEIESSEVPSEVENIVSNPDGIDFEELPDDMKGLIIPIDSLLLYHIEKDI